MDRSELPESQTGNRGLGDAPSSQSQHNENDNDHAMDEETQLFPLTGDCYHYTQLGDFEFDTQK